MVNNELQNHLASGPSAGRRSGGPTARRQRDHVGRRVVGTRVVGVFRL
jgi:hypothetical protein